MMRFNMALHSAAIFVFMALAAPTATLGQAVKVAPRAGRPIPQISSLSVSATPSGVSFTLVSGGAAIANSPVSITTDWSGLKGTTLSLYGYFTSSAAALTGSLSGDGIPSSCVFGQMATGLPTSNTAFTQTNPLGGAGASLELFSQAISNNGVGNRTDALNLTIDLTSLPTLPADTYTGTLIIQAQDL